MTVATARIETIEEALEAIGATADLLTQAERDSLDNEGYVILYDLMGDELLTELREGYDRIVAEEGKAVGFDYQREPGALRIGNLVNKGEVFDRVYTHPKFLAALYYMIRDDFHLSSLSAREPLPDFDGKQQNLHPDFWGKEFKDGHCQSADAAWMLDDFSPENGATRLVPGSHRWSTRPENVMASAHDDHPEQIIVSAPAGSVLIFNGHTWHSGTLNRNGMRRRALFPYITAESGWDQGAYMKKHLRKSTYDRISPAARYLLGVD
jgi:ectoine hydroxylase-related dioxygenase (phytanoyl-CoA dioxygenase family)